jgi:hypothetical protein
MAYSICIFRLKYCIHFSLPRCVLHAPFIISSMIWQSRQYLTKSTIMNLLIMQCIYSLISSYLVSMLIWNHEVYVLPLRWDSKQHNHIKQAELYVVLIAYEITNMEVRSSGGSSPASDRGGPGSSTESGHVGFVEAKAALGQVFSEYFSFPWHSFHRLLHTHHHPLSSGAGTIGQQWPQHQRTQLHSIPKEEKTYIHCIRRCRSWVLTAVAAISTIC